MAHVTKLKITSLALDIRRLRRELYRRQLEVDQAWYNALTLPDLKLIADEYEIPNPSPRALEVAQIMESFMADDTKTPADLRQALYGDAPQAPVLPSLPAQPMPEVAEVPLPAPPPLPAQPAPQAPPVPAGLVRVKFTGQLAPGSTSVNTIEGQKPLVKDEFYVFEQAYFGRLKRMWPSSWWQEV